MGTQQSVSQAHLQSILDSQLDGIVIVDRSGTILFCNLATATLFGRTCEELVGGDFGLPVLTEEVVELDLLHQSGCLLVAEMRAVEFVFNEEQVYLIALRDVTERRRIEEALRASARMEVTATLAGGIAHDFNNLMVGVLGNAELLKEDCADNPEALRMLSEISLSAQHAAQLAQQMLAFAGKGKIYVIPVNLNGVIREKLKVHRQSIPHGIAIQLNLAPDLDEFLADPAQMGQVVSNLILNAVEAMGEAGTLTITTAKISGVQADSQQHIRMEVQDTGCGIDAEHLAKIFEPFFTTKFQGRGLGLAAVHGIVTSHQGTIYADSTVGIGTRVTVVFPVLDHKEKVVAYAPDNPSKETKPSAPTILLVDDEAVVLRMLERLLKRRGYEILQAEGGLAALEMVREHAETIDLMVLDLGMPDLNGTRVFEETKKIVPDMKILVCSGYELNDEIQKVLADGAHGYVRKPFQIKQLIHSVQKALQEPEC